MVKNKIIALCAGMLIVGFMGGQALNLTNVKTAKVIAQKADNKEENKKADKDTQQEEQNTEKNQEETKNQEGTSDQSKQQVLEEDKQLKEFIESKKEELKAEVYNQLITLVDKLIKADQDGETEKADGIYSEMEKIMKEAGIDPGQGAGNEIRSYEVNNGQIKELDENDSQGNAHKQLWNLVKKVYPERFVNIITKLTIESDGYRNALAAVSPINEENKNFSILLDIADGFDENGNVGGREFEYTLVHELGHIISLKHDQVGKYDENSKNYTIDEGTTKEDSYLNKFFNKFWSKHKEALEEIENAKAENKENAGELAATFYDKNKEEFVTEYASTNPVEDLAESFAEFVYKDKPSGDSIVDQKLKFFYNYHELVKLRGELRSRLGLK